MTMLPPIVVPKSGVQRQLSRSAEPAIAQRLHRAPHRRGGLGKGCYCGACPSGRSYLDLRSPKPASAPTSLYHKRIEAHIGEAARNAEGAAIAVQRYGG